MLSRVSFAVVCCLAFASPARAQIYSWHDASGNLVLSDHAVDGAQVESYAVPRAASVRTTRATAATAAPPASYDDLIDRHSRESGVRTELVRAVIQVESGFNPSARSPKGAMGLMQLMPATAQQFGVRNPYSPAENIAAGVAYLRELLDRYGNNEELALAAYNAGPGAVDRHGEAVPPYRETQKYVSKVSELAGAQARRAPGTQVYRIVQTVNGREVVLFSNNPDARVNPAALPPSDPDGRTPAPAAPSSSIFPTR
jgi:soluble lytic murein transglycosylase-like protein